jgi:hypothetical protein
MYKVTTKSIWEKPATAVFDTIEEAREYAAAMRDQQYRTNIQELTAEEIQ